MIPCDLHDYVEIACTFGYPLRLTMKSGEVIEGRALDTQRDAQRRECIAIEVGGSIRLVVLDSLSEMAAQITNPHFDCVSFPH